MKRDWQQRWAKAYDRARARTRRRVDALIKELDVGDDTNLRHHDQLVGEASRFEDRVNDLLTRPPITEQPIESKSTGGVR